MDFVLDNKISIDSLLTIVLAIVFIVQTAYLVRQTNFGVRSNQANLTATWKKEFDSINVNLLIKNSENTTPDEMEFKKLVHIFERMHPLFRSRLLKPSDFAYLFMVLDGATGSPALRKTKMYRDEYLTLQHIYSHFNKDYDMIDAEFELANIDWYDKAFQRFSVLKDNEKQRKIILNNWVRYQKAAKFGVILFTKILRKPLFNLEPPI